MSKNRRMSILVVLTAAVLALAGAAASVAVGSNPQTVITNTIAAINGSKDCGTCQVVDADVSTTTSSDSFTSSHTHIKTVRTLTEKVRQYQTVNHVMVTIDQVPGGIHPSHGCIDPVAKNYIKVGGKFSNTGGRIHWRFTDYWPAGTHLCNFRLVHNGAEMYLEGTKDSCGNEGVRIYLTPHKFQKYVKVVRFHSVPTFTLVYDQWFKKATHTTSTTTTHKTYSCDTASGWTKTDDGMHCKKCPPPCPPPTTTTPPPTTTVVITTTPPPTTTTVVTTTTAPPPSHYTQVSCTGFEEIFGGESMIVKCDVSNDNGATISLDAHSNDGNSRVSGINCYSQGGTPSCRGNGQFEFRVTGINGGSTMLYSSITVTASSNGVDKTWTSNPFPVDPK